MENSNHRVAIQTGYGVFGPHSMYSKESTDRVFVPAGAPISVRHWDHGESEDFASLGRQPRVDCGYTVTVDGEAALRSFVYDARARELRTFRGQKVTGLTVEDLELSGLVEEVRSD